MKRSIGLLVMILVSAGVLFAQQAYNRDKVVTVMRENRTLVGQIQTALKGNNFGEAEKSFFRFAELNAGIQPYNPPRGDKKEWDRVMGTFVSASVRGAVASRAHDATAANAALKELLALNQEGHKLFK